MASKTETATRKSVGQNVSATRRVARLRRTPLVRARCWAGTAASTSPPMPTECGWAGAPTSQSRAPWTWAEDDRIAAAAALRSGGTSGGDDDAFLAGGRMTLPRPVESFLEEMGRFISMAGRVFAWTPRPPYDWRELLRQMVKVGFDSIPVVVLTTSEAESRATRGTTTSPSSRARRSSASRPSPRF